MVRWFAQERVRTLNGRHLVAPLIGKRVSLEPLSVDFVPELVEAASEDRSSYRFTSVPRSVSTMERYVEKLLEDAEAGVVVPFVQRDGASGRVIGMTRYLTLRTRSDGATPFAVEIGGTWLASSAQRTAANTEAKFLLLGFAFEQWGVVRVDLKTDDRNERSKAAIRRIGASPEGVLRSWQPSQVVGEESLLRDTAMFSIIDVEWPVVKARLSSMLA